MMMSRQIDEEFVLAIDPALSTTGYAIINMNTLELAYINKFTTSPKNLDDFIGINVDEISKIVGNKKVSYNLYTFNKDNKIINAYKLDNNKLLTVFVENNKISNIEIGDTNNIIDKIKDEVIDK